MLSEDEKEALHLVRSLTGFGRLPDAIVFQCKDGSQRVATMERWPEHCDGCDCGLALEGADG
jgi:hypothetical protein